ncbi:GntR family transcriptional regulator [Fervidicella metallireducens]|uniref:GntR family transcriptional regulator n=1 Tax=Fervidicella metallireducens TaxID=655338 RepID=UPI00068758A0|nr:GntR family transcriptional regulator [Fervidicella metallireducens]
MKVYESIMINRNSEEPLYIQVYEGIKGLIENGVFKPNEKLPPIRSLALKLGVNNVTIVNAYKLLEQKGFVYSKMGSGTFVRGYRTPNLSNISVQVVTTVDKESINKNKGEINLSTSTPNPKLFPVNEFKEILNEVLDRDGALPLDIRNPKDIFHFVNL